MRLRVVLLILILFVIGPLVEFYDLYNFLFLFSLEVLVISFLHILNSLS